MKKNKKKEDAYPFQFFCAFNQGMHATYQEKKLLKKTCFIFLFSPKIYLYHISDG